MTSIENNRQQQSSTLSKLAGVALVVAVALLGSGSSSAASPSDTLLPQRTPAPRPAQHHWYQIGRASWYGQLFQGQPTASGEAFDMNQLTCAHRSLPLGSLIRVTNLRNHRSVVVRVNDRGPVPENRVVDLSYAAARFLGFGRRGTAPVRLELLRTDSEVAQVSYPVNPAQRQ